MATATKSKTTTTKTTRKPAQKAAGRKTAPKTAPKAAKPAPKPVQERTVKNIVLDSAYATVGLTDTAVEVLKSLPAKAAELREEAPVRVKTQVKTQVKTLGSLTTEGPKQLTERLQTVSAQGKTTLVGLRGQVEQQVETYAARGREVIGKVQNSAATKRALDQSRIARSQVKAAATSVRKASRAAAEAADSAAEKAGTVAS